MDGSADAGIGRASTEIRHCLVDVLVGRMPVPAQKIGCGHDHAGLAIAALRNVELDPGLLNRMIGVSGQALDGGDAAPLHVADRHHACSGRHAVNMHRAGAAKPDAAAELAPGQAQMLANDPQQRDVIGAVEFGRHSVDGEFHRHVRQPFSARIEALLYLPCAFVLSATTLNASSGNGMTSRRRPVACSKACAMAGATGASTTSPIPCGGRSLASTMGTISGISSMPM